MKIPILFKFSYRFAIFLAAFFCFISTAKAQSTVKVKKGKIVGKIVDAKTGKTIIGANVYIEGTTTGAVSDIDGKYTIRNLDPGVYAVSVSYVSYGKKKITGINIKPGSTVTLNVSLVPEAIQGKEVVVTARASSSSEAGLLSVQRKSVPVQDGISSEQVAKQGDSDVAQALKRVTGVTLQNGNDVFVRGLGNRYSNVQLNGSQVPSTNPNKKEAPVDLFGSELVSNIVVQKTYTADQSAEFSGGSVKIQTREFPEDKNITLSYRTKFNSVSTFNNTLSSLGSKTDFLGYDNGMRKLPSILRNQRVNDGITSKVVKSLNNNWAITDNKKAIPSQKVSVNYANQFNRDKMPVGLVGNFSYGYDQQSEPNKTQRSILNFNDNGVNYYSDYKENQGVESADLSGMLNLFVKPSSVTKIGLKTLYTNSTTNTRSVIQGPYQNGVTRIGVINFDQRSILSSTLQADTYFKNFMASRLSGHLSYNLALRNRPDRRTTRYNKIGNRYLFQAFGGGNGHFFSDQTDNNYEGALKYEISPARFVDFSFGGNAIIKERHFTARRISYQDQIAPHLTDEMKAQPADVVLSDKNITNGTLELVETTQFTSDFYNGHQSIYAGYVSSTWNVIHRLNFEIGGRIEQSIQTVKVPSAPSLDSKYKESSKLDNTDFLPAINVTYELSNKTNLRAAFSKTLARAEFREISNFNFSDFFGGRRIYGNPELKQTNITNYDLRFETYPRGGELFAISSFYKRFDNPIELFYRFTENNEVFYNNARKADLYGIEIEGRKNIAPHLQLIANASYIYSQTTMYAEDAGRVANSERPMVGQSPYIVNVSSFYTLPAINTNFSVSYNTFGKRIVTVGRNTQKDDEYEQPFHDLGAKIDYDPGFAKFSLEVSNLLKDDHIYSQNKITTYRYHPGVTFEFGVQLSL